MASYIVIRCPAKIALAPPQSAYYTTRGCINMIPEEKMPNRDDAWNLLCEYTQSESLRKHALAVEACVRAYAQKLGGDENTWSLAGLLHDFDYERWPNAEHHPTKEHPYEGTQILRERG